MIDAKPNSQSPSLAWVVIAGLWFWLVSWVAFWMIALPFSGNKSITVGSMLSFLPWSVAPLLVGMLAWWLGFHRRRPLLASGASVGLVVGLTLWPAFIFGYLLLGILIPPVFVLAGFILEIAFLVMRRFSSRRPIGSA